MILRKRNRANFPGNVFPGLFTPVVDNFPREGEKLTSGCTAGLWRGGKGWGRGRGEERRGERRFQRRSFEFLIDNSRRDGARVMYQLIRGFIAGRRERGFLCHALDAFRAALDIGFDIEDGSARMKRIVARLHSRKSDARFSDALWLRRSGEGGRGEGIFCPGACCTYRIGFHVESLWFLGCGYSVMDYDRGSLQPQHCNAALVYMRRAYIIHVEPPDRSLSSARH